MNHVMYVFDHAGRLSGIQDVTGWPVNRIIAARSALLMIGRSAEVSDKGRAICSIKSCRMDLGERELPAGQLSHGFCPDCYQCAVESITPEEVGK
uniref:Uncharacterized protein n=1 Tax=viral metagenome TaxID=1070528 RepID=A0A6M3LBA9_9ZZZZ